MSGFSERNGHDIDESLPIDAPLLRKAIVKALDILGISAVDAIIEDLNNRGIDLASSSQYTLEQVGGAILDTFGMDATPFLMERIKRSLKDR